jgi:hypothetical protein
MVKKRTKKSKKKVQRSSGSRQTKKVNREWPKKKIGTSGTGPRLCGDSDES